MHHVLDFDRQRAPRFGEAMGQILDVADEGPRDITSRLARLEQRIRRGIDDGSLNRVEADQAMRTLESIRRDEAMLAARLDRLGEQLRAERREQRDDRRY